MFLVSYGWQYSLVDVTYHIAMCFSMKIQKLGVDTTTIYNDYLQRLYTNLKHTYLIVLKFDFR